jgi:hypothetical protein
MNVLATEFSFMRIGGGVGTKQRSLYSYRSVAPCGAPGLALWANTSVGHMMRKGKRERERERSKDFTRASIGEIGRCHTTSTPLNRSIDSGLSPTDSLKFRDLAIRKLI